MKYGADIDLKCCGTPPLHLALTTITLPNGEEFGQKCFELLLNNSVDLLLKVFANSSVGLIFKLDFSRRTIMVSLLCI